jgi:hypothetical protein
MNFCMICKSHEHGKGYIAGANCSLSTDSYFEALQGYLHGHGCPIAFYSDKLTVC